jgi:hypothetical protein
MVHTIIHRGLTPQTVTHAWLMLTLALTFALAIAHAATIHGGALPTGDAPRGASPLLAHATTAARALPTAPAMPSAVAVVGERDDATRHVPPSGPGAGSADPGAPASNAVPAEPARSRGASALAELYGGAGPHGPPGDQGSR